MRRSGVRIPLPPVFARVVEESEDRRAVALAKADIFQPCHINAASYDSASHMKKGFSYVYILQSEIDHERSSLAAKRHSEDCRAGALAKADIFSLATEIARATTRQAIFSLAIFVN